MFQALQIHLEELEARGFIASYFRVISAVSNIVLCSDDDMYIWYKILYSKLCYLIYFNCSVVRFCIFIHVLLLSFLFSLTIVTRISVLFELDMCCISHLR